jgi:RimJ/RimL family protein N-acetyltransferase
MLGVSVRLRPYRHADVPAVHAAIVESRDEVAPWLPDLLGGLDPAGLSAWIEAQAGDRPAGANYHYAIVDAVGEGFLGGCGLTNLNRRHRFANMYYWVRTGATRRGAASEAARQLARLGFGELGLQRVEIVVDCHNLASLRTAEKVGAQREGLLRNRLRSDETARDAVMFSLIPSDLE